MSIGKRATPSVSPRGYSSRRLVPTVEVIESRQLLAAGFGVIAGTAFLDSNANAILDPTESYLSGATIQLFLVGNPTAIASQVTGPNGGYSFSGLAPGNYLVRETPPASYQVSGAQAQSQVEPATTVGNQIQVTVPPAPLYLNYNGVLPGSYQVTNNLVNGAPEVDSEGQLQVSLGTKPGATDINPGFLTQCLDDLHRLTFVGGEKFQVVPTAITALTNGTTQISADRAGRIAFLYNHFGNASLSNIQAPALQLAIWELIYDTGTTADFQSGNFQVVGPDAPFTDQPTLDAVLAQAATYFNQSAGKSEAAILLDASISQAPGVFVGSQSMIAQGSFNFANTPTPTPTPSSIAGFVYCDDNLDGAFDNGDDPIAGSLVALTGTAQDGSAVKLTSTTDTTGAYQFLNLTPGTYSITVVSTPPGYVPAQDTQGTPGNGRVQVNRIVNIQLAAGVNGKNNDFGFTGQAVDATKLELIGIHHQPSQIVLHFNGPLDAAAAQTPGNYSLIGLGKDEIYGSRDDVPYSVTSATYDPSNATVTLTPSQHLNIHYHYVLSFNLPGVNPCAPAVSLTTVFGRTAVPSFNIHGVIKPNPPLIPTEVRHNDQVVARTLATLGQSSNGLASAAALPAATHSQSAVVGLTRVHSISSAHALISSKAAGGMVPGNLGSGL